MLSFADDPQISSPAPTSPPNSRLTFPTAHCPSPFACFICQENRRLCMLIMNWKFKWWLEGHWLEERTKNCHLCFSLQQAQVWKLSQISGSSHQLLQATVSKVLKLLWITSTYPQVSIFQKAQTEATWNISHWLTDGEGDSGKCSPGFWADTSA